MWLANILEKIRGVKILEKFLWRLQTILSPSMLCLCKCTSGYTSAPWNLSQIWLRLIVWEEMQNKLFKFYIEGAEKILKQLNSILNDSVFKYIFLTYRAGKVLFLHKRKNQQIVWPECRCVCFKKRKHVHIEFKIALSDYECFDCIITFVSDDWEKRKIFFSGYGMIYPRLISSMKWRFEYVLFWKKEKKMTSKRNQMLKELRNEIVDAVSETFTKKYYFVKISQSKNGHVYLIVKNKRGRLLSEGSTVCIEKYLRFLQLLSTKVVFI